MLRAFAFASLLTWLAVALVGDLREQKVAFLALWCLLAALYLGAVWAVGRAEARGTPGLSARGLILWAVLMRLPMLLGPATLSDDVHRYVRDGWVQVNGINPYAQAPDDPALEQIRLPDHDQINNPSIPTIYPPLAQGLFAIGAWISPAPGAIKALVTLFDLATVLLLISWLRETGRPPGGALLYAWHPLVIVEGAGSGHIDIIGAFFLLLTVRAIIRGRPLASSFALAAATLTKLLPLALAPVWWRRLRAWQWGLVAALLLVAIAPYARGAGGHLGTGFGEYASRWEFNGCVFPAVRWLTGLVDTPALLKPQVEWLIHTAGDPAWLSPLWGWVYAPTVARVLCGLLYLAVVLRGAPGGLTAERDAFFALGALILFSPTVHPWYLVWIVPFLALRGSAAWTWLTLTVVFSYAAPAGAEGPAGVGSGGVPVAVWLLEYAGMAIVSLWARALARP